MIPVLEAADSMSSRVPSVTFTPSSTGAALSPFGLADDANGMMVTPDTALGISAFWAGVTLIAEAISVMPIKVWRSVKSGRREWADQHPSNYCLTKTTNGWQTPSMFKSFSQGCLLMNGNSCAEVVRNGRGQATELYHWLPANTVYGVNGNSPMYGVGMNSRFQGMDAAAVVNFRDYKSMMGIEWFPFTEVVHLTGFSTNGFTGRSVLSTSRPTLGLSQVIDRFAYRNFVKGRPAGFITKDGKITPDQRKVIMQEWAEMQEGVHNAFALGLLSHGLEWQDIGWNNADAEVMTQRNFQVGEVSRILHISPHMLGDLSQVSEANIEQLMLEFITYTLLPWMNRWEEQLNIKLFTPMEQFNYTVQFDIEAFLRGDKLTTAKADESNIRNGLRTPNETRGRDGFNPYEDGSGDVPLAMASQLGTLKQIEDGTSPLQAGPTGSDSSSTTTADEPKKPKPKPKPVKK